MEDVGTTVGGVNPIGPRVNPTPGCPSEKDSQEQEQLGDQGS